MRGISNLQGHVVEMMKDNKQHLLKHDVHLEKLDKLLERQQLQMERQGQQMEHQQLQMERQQQQIASMERFNLQTRRMWISMARQMDWPYEDPDLDS